MVMLVAPDGVIHQAFMSGTDEKQNHQWSLEAFTQHHKLDRSHISKVISGQRHQHNGWRLCATVDADKYAVNSDAYLSAFPPPAEMNERSVIRQQSKSGVTTVPLKPKVKAARTMHFFFNRLAANSSKPEPPKFTQPVSSPRGVYSALGCSTLPDGSKVSEKLSQTHFETALDKLDERRLRTLINAVENPVMIVLRAFVGNDAEDLLQMLAQKKESKTSSLGYVRAMKLLQEQPMVQDAVHSYN